MEPLVFRGLVQKGIHRAESLGFPTVNIPLADKKISGIYAARVTVAQDEDAYMAAVYADQKRGVLEAHLLDFDDDLYDMEIEISLLGKIREDKKFEGEAELSAAIQDDISRVREYFNG